MTRGSLRRSALALATSLLAVAATAQTVDSGTQALDIPADPQIFAQPDDPNVRKATAIVNGSVITGTDVDQRMALITMAYNGQVPAEELPRLRAQVLRNLIDETLQIQAAKVAEIDIKPAEIEQYYGRYAQNLKRSPKELAVFLQQNGASERSIKRQIEGEIAWSRLQGRDIEPFVNVSEDEVRAVLDRLNASKGTQEYHVAEIFLSATPETANETLANANRIVEQLAQGAPFSAYARQFSEASTAAVGGDLGWVRAEQLPQPLADAARTLSVGRVSPPIAVPGGFSILALVDSRQVLTADPRDAVLSLKQLTVTFPPGATRAQAAPKVEQLAKIGQTMGGCGGADAAATAIGAEVIASDQVRVRDLPPALQEMLVSMSIGQTTSPFGSVEEGVRVLVLCGRDDPQAASGPSFDQVYAQIEEQRINLRARRYLRDLRRDAVIDYR